MPSAIISKSTCPHGNSGPKKGCPCPAIPAKKSTARTASFSQSLPHLLGCWTGCELVGEVQAVFGPILSRWRQDACPRSV